MKPVLIIIGPSGVGKSSVLSHLRGRAGLTLVPTWTTRPPRSYESGALADHEFVDAATFERMETQEYFMATTSMFGLSYRYGLPHRRHWSEADDIPVIMLRASLFDDIKQHFSSFFVYQIEAPIERVAAHMHERLIKEGDIGTRLALFSQEISQGRKVAHRRFQNSTCASHTAEDIWRCIIKDFPEISCPA